MWTNDIRKFNLENGTHAECGRVMIVLIFIQCTSQNWSLATQAAHSVTAACRSHWLICAVVAMLVFILLSFFSYYYYRFQFDFHLWCKIVGKMSVWFTEIKHSKARALCSMGKWNYMHFVLCYIIFWMAKATATATAEKNNKQTNQRRRFICRQLTCAHVDSCVPCDVVHSDGKNNRWTIQWF